MTSDEVIARLTRLLQLLEQRTNDDLLTWTGREEVEEVYDSSISHTSFTIQTRDRDGTAPYVLTVWGSRGSVGAVFETDDHDLPAELRKRISDLYREVAQRADVQRTIGALDLALKELEEMPPF